MQNIDKKQFALIVFIVGAIIFGAGFKIGQNRGKPATAIISESESVDGKTDKLKKNEKNEVVVYVSGAVKKPGLYHLKNGARVADAVYLAGPAKNADLESINLAEMVADSQQIQVFAKEDSNLMSSGADANLQKGAGKAQTNERTSSTKPSGKVNINRAKVEDLDKLPGIGPSTAQKIIDYRNNHGRFNSVDELTNVSGIGVKKLEKIKNLITI